MPITGLPTFSAGILTAASLNAIVTALETKFSGQIGGGDISWPLQAGGDIDMGQYRLVNVPKFWNMFNAAERPTGDTLQDVLDDINALGGGILIIPSNHTEVLPAAGVTPKSETWIVGEGPSSIIQAHASGSDDMIHMGATSDNVVFANLRFQGVSSVDQKFIDFENAAASNVRIFNCKFDTHGEASYIHFSAAAENVSISNNHFIGNGDSEPQHMIFLAAAKNVRILKNNFKDWSNSAIFSTPTAAVANVLVVGNALVNDNSTSAVQTVNYAIGFSNSSAVAACQNIMVNSNSISGKGSGIGGVYSDDFDRVMVCKNTIYTNKAKPAIHVYNGTGGVFNGNNLNCQAGSGIVIGSTGDIQDAGRAADQFTGFALCHNVITTHNQTATYGIGIVVVGGNSPISAAVAGNRAITTNANVFQIWNLLAAPTVKPTQITITGNHFFCNDAIVATRKGFASYTDMGTTNTADIGTGVVSHWFTMVGNTIPNSVAGVDYTTGSNKTVVADNNT